MSSRSSLLRAATRATQTRLLVQGNETDKATCVEFFAARSDVTSESMFDRCAQIATTPVTLERPAGRSTGLGAVPTWFVRVEREDAR